MKKPSPLVIILAATFFALLMAYLGSRIVQHESAQHAMKQVEQQPSVRAQSLKRNAYARALMDASLKEQTELSQKAQELDKSGVKGEQRREELLKTFKASEQERAQTLEKLKEH